MRVFYTRRSGNILCILNYIRPSGGLLYFILEHKLQSMQSASAAVAREAGAAARMRAWRLHAYGAEPALERARRPALHAPDQLLVRVHTASVNPIDVAMIGGYGRRVLNALRALEGGGGGVEFPLVLGRDFVGDVVCAGADARLRRGARVWGVLPPHWPGSHADYVVVRDQWAGAAPEVLGAAAGGGLYAALSATSLLRAAGLAAGEGGARGRRVLLLGLGAVGQAALQMLAVDGALVTVGAAADLHAAARAAGAQEVLDRHAPDYDERLVAGGPYDAILDCAGLGGDEAAARPWRYSRYVTLTSPLLRETDARGLAAGTLGAAAALAAQCARAKRAQPAAAPSPHVRWAYFTPSASDIELLRRRAEAGQFTVYVGRVWAAAEGGAAVRAAREGARGKQLIDFSTP